MRLLFKTFVVILCLYSSFLFSLTEKAYLPPQSCSFSSSEIKQKIYQKVKQLSRSNIDSKVFGKDLASFENDDMLFEWLEAYVPIKNHFDLYRIFKNRFDSQLNAIDVDEDLLTVYNIFFNESWKPHEYKFTIFSGGSGSNTLTAGLLDYTTQLDILINAYDDLKNTSNGTIRREFNVLGPSDIIKNLVNLLDMSYPENAALKSFLKYRLPKDIEPKQSIMDLQLIANNYSPEFDLSLQTFYKELSNDYKRLVSKYVKSFLNEVQNWEIKNNRPFDIRDFAVRNIIFTGLLFNQNINYENAIRTFREYFHVDADIILNNDKPLWLIGLSANGNLLNSEGDIAQSFLSDEIENVYIVKSLLSDEQARLFNSFTNLDSKKEFLNSLSTKIEQSKESEVSLCTANVIIFAPTTIYSNVIPTLKTGKISKLLAESKALKILVANLVQERGHKTLGESLENLLHFCNDPYNKNETIHYVIADIHDNTKDKQFLIPIDEDYIKNQNLELIRLKVTDSQFPHLHNSLVISKVITQLQSLRRAGYNIKSNSLIKSSSFLPATKLYSELNDEERIRYNQMISDRLELYKQNRYSGIMLDVDGTITDESGQIPEKVLKILKEYVSKGIILGINTARTDESLNNLLLKPLTKHFNYENKLLEKVWVYSNNGAHGYTLDGTDLYGYEIPPHVAEPMMQRIYHEILDTNDNYRISNYKISIWPETKKNPQKIIDQTNKFFKKNHFPFNAKLGTHSINTRSCIIITHAHVNKKNALIDFANRTDLELNSILKVGDRAEPGGVDNDWLIGKGGFSVDGFDVSKSHVPTTYIDQQLLELEGTMWLFEHLTFNFVEH